MLLKESSDGCQLLVCLEVALTNLVEHVPCGLAVLHLRGDHNIVIPDGVDTICIWAFYGCSGLTSINIPNSVKDIEFAAFGECLGLSEITIPSSVISLGNGVFNHCCNLVSVSLLSEIPPTLAGDLAGAWCSIDDNGSTLTYYPSNLSINVPCGTVDTYKAAWPYYAYWIRQPDDCPKEDIPEIQNSNKTYHKIFNDGQILILRDDKTYTVIGQEVK